jgi:L-lactate dehydrogenase
VVGEHGDTEVLTWSLVSVGGIPLEDYLRERDLELASEDKAYIDERTRRAAYRIIEGKKATYYGIGSALANIVNVVLRDQRSILTICAPMADVAGVKDVTVALPHLLGGVGVLDDLPLPLHADEQAALKRSAETVRKAIDSLS